MDDLLKQLRVNFSGLEERQDDVFSSREGRLPPQKTVSFKGERKKAKSWFRRQFSGQLSEEDDSAELEFGAAAAAAAALAVLLAEEEHGFTNQKKPVDELERSLTKTKSRREDSLSRSTDERKTSRWISGEDAKEDGRLAGDSFKRKPSTLNERMRVESASDSKIQEKTSDSIPSTKKTPSLSDKDLNETGSKLFNYGRDNRAGQGAPPSMKPITSYSSNGFKTENRIESTGEVTKVEAWEHETMEKIRKRYEKMNNTILQWENEKKVKAKRQKERKERALEMRRARILQEFREETIRIDMIASGARAVADDTRRSEELKTKEKAKKMRSTRKAPRKCFCF